MLRYFKLLVILGLSVVLYGCNVPKEINSSNNIYSTAIVEENTNNIKLIIYKNNNEDINSDVINNIKNEVQLRYYDKSIEIEVKKIVNYLDSL